MTRDNIATVDDMRRYMEYWAGRGAAGFSFRGLTVLDGGKRYADEASWSWRNLVSLAKIADEVADAPDFTFLQQKIGDHYWFEMYEWNGFPVRLTYSNFSWLASVEQKEREVDAWFTRALIVHPDDSAYAGWTYDINRLKSAAPTNAASPAPSGPSAPGAAGSATPPTP